MIITLRGFFERGDQLFDRMAADDTLPLGPAGEEIIDLRGRAVEDGHGVAAAFDVEDKVFTHDRQADQADVRGGSRHWRVSQVVLPAL